jgi:hypothetical protein
LQRHGKGPLCHLGPVLGPIFGPCYGIDGRLFY